MSADKRKQQAAIWRKTTTSINRNGNNDETASSAGETNRNSAIISARSPRKMKTQIAKLVYDPTTTKSNRDVFMNENETPVVAASAAAVVVVEEDYFQKKRQDRDKEVKQIQEMLNEITNTPTKEEKSTGETAEQQQSKKEAGIKKNPPTKKSQPVQRSKTEANLRQPTARRSQQRLEPKIARSKSAQNREEKENTSPKKTQKAYSSEEARRYMQEQKKKRKSLQTLGQTADGKPDIDRSEIKKRLDSLRKNTRQIVNKNVKMAKQKSIVTKPTAAKQSEPKPRPVEEKPIPPQVVAKDIQIKSAKVEIQSEKVENKKSPIFEKPQVTFPLTENYKKVGLLRKPEFKDHSFSAIKDLNIDKENLILDVLTPKLQESWPKDMVTHEPNKPELILSDKMDHSKKSDSSAASSKLSSISNLDLKIPEAKLRTHISVREKSVQVDRSVQSTHKQQQQQNAELPYWLKPTAAQAYPYNFIMAVRKKLEAIASPPAVAASSLDHQQTKVNSNEMLVSFPKSTNIKRRLIESDDKTLSKENITEHRSEITSNFSSISIQLPESDTASSLQIQKHHAEERKPQRFDEDDTTVSSSVFSSPEKKRPFSMRSKNPKPDVAALSPLSVENISNLHIHSKSMLNNVTMNRGDQFSNSSLHRKTVSGTITTSRSEASVDFSQLLDDFNRSLSQVIEVNHQLKTTLVKSHQLFSPEKNKRPSPKPEIKSGKSIELAEYVSDFEESSSTEEKPSKESNGSRSNNSSPKFQTASNQSNEAKTSSSNEESPIQSSSEEIPSQGRSFASLETQTFIVTSEDTARDSPRTQTIHEEVIEESPNKDNMSGNQYSRDSLEMETSPRGDYIKGHINTSRGDFQNEESEQSAGPPPSYKATSKSRDTAHRSQPNFMNSSLDSEFVRVFNSSDYEISVLSLNRSMSESAINYSSIGLYEKLIQNETNKSEHLAALLKMREKALMDRTKGQIAWLEVQKVRYKAKGLTLQISAVKKKQRGILLKMEKEREEIKKLLQQAKVQRDHKLRIPESRPSTDVTLLQHRSRTGVQTSAASQAATVYQQQKSQHLHKHQNLLSARSKPSAIVRGYELETSRSLEKFLHKREEDLRRRREHVERLMEWHRRLDQEEAEVLQLERMLLDYNNVHVQQETAHDDGPNHTKMEKKLKEIDRSLRELSSISGGEGSAENCGDFVRTNGNKLNKLWRRLTSRRDEKFEPNKRYKLCKADLEHLYEDAKLAVLHDFGDNVSQMEVFLSQPSISTTQQSIIAGEVPHLNLNFSSGQSDTDMVGGIYSPSAAEEGFMRQGGLSSEESERETLRRNTTSGSYSLSALPSLESEQSSSSEAARSEQIKPRESASYLDGQTSLPERRVSNETNAPESGLNSASTVSGISGSNCVMQSFSNVILMESLSLPKTSTETIPEAASTETDSKQTSLPGSVLNSASSTKTESDRNSLAESFKNSHESVSSKSFSLIQNSRSSITDDALTAPATETNLTKTNSSPKTASNSVETAVNSRSSVSESIFSARTQSNRISSIESTALPQNSKCSVTKVQTSVRESSSLIGSNPKTESGAVNTLNSGEAKVNQLSLIENASNDNTAIQGDDASEIILELEWNTGLIPSQLVHTRSGTTTISLRGSLPESASIIQIDHPQTRTSSNYTTNRSTDGSISTSSIVKSLLQCSNGAIISENSAIAELSRMSSKSEKEIRALTNGHDQLEDQKTANQSEFDDETCTTLRSINSIDNSTNSKHSTHLATNSHSSKRKSSSTECHEILSTETTPSHRQTSGDTTVVYTPTFDYSEVSSNQHRSSVIISTGLSPTQEDDSRTLTNAFYESDFTEGEESNIDDVSLPKFETTGEEEDNQFIEPESNIPANSNELKKRLIDLDVSLKDLNATFEKALSPEKAGSPPHVSKQPKEHNSDSALMPDIISEVEVRRRQQVMLENEIRQFEHAVPYMYVREIPNKPPPPYVPPAHGSPMTTIFPSEERIKDITYRRTKELYSEILNIDTTDDQGKRPPSVLDENITNIYERIILDICKEYLTEYEPVLTSADPNNFHSALAFFNPPDRLKCMQDFIYKEVRKSLAMDKNSQKRNQAFSVYGHRGKRDHIGEIIIQEMFEEDDRWSNFYVEEAEVVELIIEEMIGAAVKDIATEVLEAVVPKDPLVPLAADT